MKNLVKHWGPVVLWITVIAIESTSDLSAANTGPILWRVLSACFGHLDPSRFDLLHLALRKVGHFTGYAVLCLLIFRGLRASFQHAALSVCSALAVWVTFLVACADEWHQSFLPSRTGLFRDVLLDTAGAIAAQAVVLIAASRRARTSGLDPSVVSRKFAK